MKLGKAFLLVLMENVFCLSFFGMICNTLFYEMNWGVLTILIIGLFWLVSFSMCVVGMSECMHNEKDKETN